MFVKGPERSPVPYRHRHEQCRTTRSSFARCICVTVHMQATWLPTIDLASFEGHLVSYDTLTSAYFESSPLAISYLSHKTSTDSPPCRRPYHPSGNQPQPPPRTSTRRLRRPPGSHPRTRTLQRPSITPLALASFPPPVPTHARSLRTRTRPAPTHSSTSRIPTTNPEPAPFTTTYVPAPSSPTQYPRAAKQPAIYLPSFHGKA